MRGIGLLEVLERLVRSTQIGARNAAGGVPPRVCRDIVEAEPAAYAPKHTIRGDEMRLAAIGQKHMRAFPDSGLAADHRERRPPDGLDLLTALVIG